MTRDVGPNLLRLILHVAFPVFLPTRGILPPHIGRCPGEAMAAAVWARATIAKARCVDDPGGDEEEYAAELLRCLTEMN